MLLLLLLLLLVVGLGLVHGVLPLLLHAHLVGHQVGQRERGQYRGAAHQRYQRPPYQLTMLHPASKTERKTLLIPTKC